MNDKSFADLPWHDAEILSIEIDRRSPGLLDEVVLVVTWPDEVTSRIRFQNCWRLEALMNFGIVAPESVLTASEDSDSEGLRRVREKWSKVGLEVSDLRCFSIETNSTASTISVYAQQWAEESISEHPGETASPGARST